MDAKLFGSEVECVTRDGPKINIGGRTYQRAKETVLELFCSPEAYQRVWFGCEVSARGGDGGNVEQCAVRVKDQSCRVHNQSFQVGLRQ